eukprot:TRINITY_DN20661_c0_g1_i2.p1 TRINITY_DN20661_c0_g1~~TRINITY_DN20661_c0_g1_i2.p1  ORF type:complete len:364 (-),score=41.01 TRINITY_DN20661_c0_g1_i2:36-1127(-)
MEVGDAPLVEPWNSSPHSSSTASSPKIVDQRFHREGEGNAEQLSTSVKKGHNKITNPNYWEKRNLLAHHRPHVHVLLRPMCPLVADPPALVLPQVRGTVGVMGLHASGSKIMTEYVKKYFDVDVEPEARRIGGAGGRKDTGTLFGKGCFPLWKHTVPLRPVALPPRVEDVDVGNGCGGSMVGHGPLLLLLFLVRDVRSWMGSLAERPYEINRSNGGRRRQGKLHWMFDEIQMRTEGGTAADPFANALFASVPMLWVAYANGYLMGALLGDDPTPCAIIRFEDVVKRPVEVLEGLERLGLPRRKDSGQFEPIETVTYSNTGCTCRADVISRLDSCTVASRVAEDLAPHVALFDALGYPRPSCEG